LGEHERNQRTGLLEGVPETKASIGTPKKKEGGAQKEKRGVPSRRDPPANPGSVMLKGYKRKNKKAWEKREARKNTKEKKKKYGKLQKKKIPGIRGGRKNAKKKSHSFGRDANEKKGSFHFSK